MLGRCTGAVRRTSPVYWDSLYGVEETAVALGYTLDTHLPDVASAMDVRYTRPWSVPGLGTKPLISRALVRRPVYFMLQICSSAWRPAVSARCPKLPARPPRCGRRVMTKHHGALPCCPHQRYLQELSSPSIRPSGRGRRGTVPPTTNLSLPQPTWRPHASGAVLQIPHPPPPPTRRLFNSRQLAANYQHHNHSFASRHATQYY